MKKIAVVRFVILGVVLALVFLAFELYYRPTFEYEGNGGIGAVSVGVSGALIVSIVLAIIALAMVGLWTIVRSIFRRAFKK